jgi:hypothetical protein
MARTKKAKLDAINKYANETLVARSPFLTPDENRLILEMLYQIDGTEARERSAAETLNTIMFLVEEYEGMRGEQYLPVTTAIRRTLRYIISEAERSGPWLTK